MTSSVCSCVGRFPSHLERIEDNTFVYRPHYVGKHILICGRRSSRFPSHCMVGPDWSCMLVTYSFISVPTFFFLYNVGSRLGWWVFMVGTFTGFLALLFFSLTACTDPGIVYDLPPTCKSLKVPSEDTTLVALENGDYCQPVNASTSNTISAEIKGAESNIAVNQESLVSQAPETPDTITDALMGSSIAAQPTIVTSCNDENDNIANDVVPSASNVASILDQASPSNARAQLPSRQIFIPPKVGLLPIPRKNEAIECGSCSLKRPVTASHCYDCGLCIDEIDHHCPWTGKCIAKKNIRTFYYFLYSLSVHIVFVLGVTIYGLLGGYPIFSMP